MYVRGHVKKIKKRLWKWVGGSSVQLEIKKNGKYIFKQYFITFLGEYSNVNNVINALLCLSCLVLYWY